MHMAAWGLWATWGVMACVTLVFILDTLRRMPDPLIFLGVTLGSLTVAFILPFTAVEHLDRPLAEIGMSLTAWAPIGLITITGLVRWIFGHRVKPDPAIGHNCIVIEEP